MRNKRNIGIRGLLIALTLLLVWAGAMPVGAMAGEMPQVLASRPAAAGDGEAASPGDETEAQAAEGASVFAGGDGSAGNPYLIETAEQMHAVRNDLTAHYALSRDIDLSAYVSGAGWEPIGNFSSLFEGTFDGRGHTITGLTVNRRFDINLGLFSVVGSGGIIENIILKDIKVGEWDYYQQPSGGLAGANYGIINNAHVTGTVLGSNYTGGLTGNNYNRIIDSSFQGTVSGFHLTGGLVGINDGEISRSFASAQVSGMDQSGGLIGWNEGAITDSYAKGTIEAERFSGGLVGANAFGGQISTSYFNGTITGDLAIGGLVGTNGGNIVSSYWNTSEYSDAPPDNGYGTAVTEEEMKRRSTYEGWDFADAWYLYDEEALPFLQWEDPFVDADVRIDSAILDIGDTAQITVAADHRHSSFDATLSAEYGVAEGDAVVSVNQAGQVTAAAYGRASIAVTLHGDTALLDVAVNPYTITGIEPTAPMAVDNGTRFEEIGLPPTVQAVLSPGGAKREIAVEWDDADERHPYQAAVPGMYTFVGHLTNLPADVGNPNQVTAAVDVAVGMPILRKVAPLNDITAAYGTERTALGLPERVQVTLSSGDTVETAVAWDDGNPAYDGTKAGTYTFTGTLFGLPEGVGNPSHLTATVRVFVGMPYLTEVAPLNDITAAYGTERTALGLSERVQATLSSGDTVEAVVSWDNGSPAYDGTKAGTYTFTGTLSGLPEGIGNPDGLTAAIRVTVMESPRPPSRRSSRGGGVRPLAPMCVDGSIGKTMDFDQGQIVFPAGAWNGSFCVEMNEAEDQKLPLSDGEQLVSPVISVAKNPTGDFQKAVTLTLQFDNDAIEEDTANVRLVRLYALNDETNEWSPLDSAQVDWEKGTVSAMTVRFTRFAAVAVNAEPEEQPQRFADLRGHWAEDEIRQLAALGAIGGYPDGTFQPDRSITRAEFVSLLVNALMLEKQGDTTFSDTENHWAKDAIAAAQASGIVEGYTKDRFGVNDPITREQMAAMIMRAVKFAAGEHAVSFADRDEISAWALGAVASLAERGIISGYPDGSFKPTNNATRAEAAVFLLRAVKASR